MKGDFI